MIKNTRSPLYNFIERLSSSNPIVIIFIVFIVLIIIIVIEWKSHQYVKNQIIIQVQEQLLSRSRSTARSIEIFLEDHIASIEQIASSRTLIEKLNTVAAERLPNSKMPLIQSYLNAHKGHIKIMQLIDSKGTVIFNTGDAGDLGIDLSKSFDVAFVLREKKQYVSGCLLNKDGNYLSYVLVPVLFDSKLVGIIRCSFNMQAVCNLFIQPVKIGTKGYMMSINRTGSICYHPEKEIVGERINLSDNQKKIFNKILAHREGWGASPASQLFETKSFFAWSSIPSVPQETGLHEQKENLLRRTVTDNNIYLNHTATYASEGLWVVISVIPMDEVSILIEKHAVYILGLALLALLMTVVGLSTFYHLKNKSKDLESDKKYLQKIVDTNEKLKESEQRYRAFFDQAPGAIILVDSQSGKIIDTNDNATEKLGYTSDEFRQLNINDIDVYMSEDMIKNKTRTILKKGYDKFETQLKRKDGHVRNFTVSSRGIFVDGKRVVQNLCHDISEEKIAEAEALRAGQLAAVGELASGMAHEINNPITGIINYAEILKEEMHGNRQNEQMIEGIIKESERIAKIVKNLLFFAKDMGEGISPVHLKEIVFSALTLIERQLANDGIHLTVDIPADIPLVEAHSHQVQHIFVNIISNARHALNIKYEDFDENKKLEITGQAVNENNQQYVRICFYDTGIGIPEKYHQKILEPFFSLKPEGHGTGLGLSVGYSIIKKHNGKIGFESIEGKFTKVILDFPVMKKSKRSIYERENTCC